MIVLKNKSYSFNIPTSWNDVSYSQWLQISLLEDDYDILEVLTGMSRHILGRLSDKNLYQINLLLQFIKDETDFLEYEVEVVDIRQKEYGQKIELTELIKANNDNLQNVLAEIVAIYSMDDYDVNKLNDIIEQVKQKPITYVYPLAMNYINQINSIVELEHSELSIDPTSEQIRAGINDFDQFGVLNTIKALAQNNILNYDKILKIEYNVVFSYLKMSKTETVFRDRYSKIMRTKK